MPVKRLFSALLEDDIASILPTFGRGVSDNNTDETTPETCLSWPTDDEDSGLGSDEVFASNDDDEVHASKRQRTSDIQKILADDNQLIADGSKPYSLPTVQGIHTDIKSISAKTLSSVMSGTYNDVIKSYRIIDCRYPYEFKGGHIQGAENRYHQSMILDLLQQCSSQVLIFHCEFSQERGPTMLRYLRSKDREMNTMNYPSLHFPEIYLVDGGYKAVYEKCPNVCEPATYRPMNHPDFSADLRHFRRTTDKRFLRSRSKTWSAGDRNPLSRKVIF